MDKTPDNLAVFIPIHFLPAILAESTTRGFQSPVPGFALGLSQSHYHCYRLLCDGGTQGMNENYFFAHI